jgi:hypothetical protein
MLMHPESEGSELHRQFDVLVCTGELVFSGKIYCDFSQRLIDALNEGIRTETRSRLKDFLTLEDVTCSNPKGRKTKVPHLHISKNNIIFVAQARSATPDKPLTTYPFSQKLPVTVAAYAAGAATIQFKISGCIYIDTWGHITDTLGSEERFMPLTQAKIEPSMPGNRSRFDFIALNKERIVSIGEISPE